MISFTPSATARVMEAPGKEELDKDAQHFLTRYLLEGVIREMYPGANPGMFPREEPRPRLPSLPLPDDDVCRDALRLGLLQVDKDSLGKPYAGFIHGVCCISLSHCRYAAAAAAGSEACGIDVERRFDWKEKLADRVFHPDEKRMIEKLALTEPEKRDFLGRIWSRKEAYLKCLGTGLLTDMRSICVIGEDSFITGRQESPDRVQISGKTWYFQEQQNERYTLCVCSLQKHIVIQTRKS